MDFLFSNLPPLRTRHPEFASVFYSLIPAAIRMDIAVGYITTDSIAELRQTIAFNKNIEQLNLIIGMHYLDRFTGPEYKAATGLNDFLRAEGRGGVRLVTPFRFHGKLYSYSNASGAFAGIIGSNNLSSIVKNHTRTYETSAITHEKVHAVKIFDFINQLSADATDNLADCTITAFKKFNPLLDKHENVIKVPNDEQADVLSSLTETKFTVPLVKNGHVPEKSNLNVYFGEGRRSRTGVIKPRHWYETELIIPSTICKDPEYPKKDSPSAIFDVVTDDGWKFSCRVSGDYSKNLRSEDDLKILGRWIKGRLENQGALDVGSLVTPETFARYGRSDFILTKTTTPNLWYIDFGVK